MKFTDNIWLLNEILEKKIYERKMAFNLLCTLMSNDSLILQIELFYKQTRAVVQ